MTMPVTHADVIAAAITIADKSGLDAVDMRTVAAALNVTPTSLHHHFADTDDLVRDMIDTIVAEYHPPLLPDSWDHAVRSRILAARQELHNHPWLQRAIQTSSQITPAMIGHTNALAGDFVAGGFSYQSTHHAMQILGYRIWGITSHPFTPPDQPPLDIAGCTFPHAAAIAHHAASPSLAGGNDADSGFGFTLDLLLDTIGQLLPPSVPATATRRQGSKTYPPNTGPPAR